MSLVNCNFCFPHIHLICLVYVCSGDTRDLLHFVFQVLFTAPLILSSKNGIHMYCKYKLSSNHIIRILMDQIMAWLCTYLLTHSIVQDIF